MTEGRKAARAPDKHGGRGPQVAGLVRARPRGNRLRLPRARPFRTCGRGFILVYEGPLALLDLESIKSPTARLEYGITGSP